MKKRTSPLQVARWRSVLFVLLELLAFRFVARCGLELVPSDSFFRESPKM